MTRQGLWKQMTEVRSAAVVLAAAVGLGVTVTIATIAFVGIPQRVSAVEGVNARQDSVLAQVRGREMDMSNKLDRVLCLVEALAAEQDPVGRGCVR